MQTVTPSVYEEKFRETLLTWGFSDKIAHYIVDFSVLFIILFCAVLVFYITKFILNRFLKRIVEKSASKWDDYLYEERVFTRLALLIPALIIQLSLETSVHNHPHAIHLIEVVLRFYMISIVILATISFLNAVHRIYGEYEVAESKPIKSYIQIGKIIVYVIGGIIMISALIGQSPLSILAGLGALSAVLLLVFKDSLLGFVAGIQLSSNNMLKINDWIVAPKHNADGIVLDITLVTVKVRNWDNSVTLIPTYSLVTDSFMNWRSMDEAGGRRLRRYFLIDVRSVRVVNEKLREKVKGFNIPEDAFKEQGLPATNLGLFRRYLQEYLKNVPEINQDSLHLVRVLQATEAGLPVEITVYTRFPEFTGFEAFQSKFFEHIYAVLPAFELGAYQRPGSIDVVPEN
ncbi:MAG: mechanosensitive ion channel [Bacteroidetes bacterium]|nr:mechanosensitive ion channel [Bacteroidota bacterium]